ncbi:hypothetical protein EYF80_020890 [Liparis tanakae]|uniref:Uncharacterized protein n=1 Tax=Liparis tanakae TaxID=230148 RepID=A0A4Z2HU55_9TELE|nr:hypothetical protein EYF80_020890 [Liparis tanakae]
MGARQSEHPGAWFFLEADGRGGSSGVDDYPVKANVMIWTGPVTGGSQQGTVPFPAQTLQLVTVLLQNCRHRRHHSER